MQRFISPDPLGFGSGDVNPYAYAGNSPTNYRDPSGQFAELVVGCAIGAGINVATTALSNRLAGRKNTAGGLLKSGALGCVFGVVDPAALVEEGLGLAAGEGLAAQGAEQAATEATQVWPATAEEMDELLGMGYLEWKELGFPTDRPLQGVARLPGNHLIT